MSVTWCDNDIKFSGVGVLWIPHYPEGVLTMSEANYKVNEASQILYQAPNAESGLSGVVAEIYLPSGVKDSDFPDVALVERGSTGTYVGSFTPDEQGDWEVIMHKSDGDGQVIKRYSVGGHNIHAIGEGVSALPDTAAVNAEVDQALVDYDGPTKTELDSAHSVTDGKIDALDIKVSSLDTPPMCS